MSQCAATDVVVRGVVIVEVDGAGADLGGGAVVVVERAGCVVFVVGAGAVVEVAAGMVVVVVLGFGSVVGTTMTDDPAGMRILCVGSVRTARYKTPSPTNSNARTALERRMRSRAESGCSSQCSMRVRFTPRMTSRPAS